MDKPRITVFNPVRDVFDYVHNRLSFKGFSHWIEIVQFSHKRLWTDVGEKRRNGLSS